MNYDDYSENERKDWGDRLNDNMREKEESNINKLSIGALDNIKNLGRFSDLVIPIGSNDNNEWNEKNLLDYFVNKEYKGYNLEMDIYEAQSKLDTISLTFCLDNVLFGEIGLDPIKSEIDSPTVELTFHIYCKSINSMENNVLCTKKYLLDLTQYTKDDKIKILIPITPLYDNKFIKII